MDAETSSDGATREHRSLSLIHSHLVDLLSDTLNTIHSHVDRVGTASAKENEMVDTRTQTLEPRGSLSGNSFTCFSRLPLELRLKIWSHATEFSQVINVRLTNESQTRDKHYVPRNSQCALTRVCNESRKESLKSKLPFYTDPCHPVIYTNLAIDTIWISQSNSHVQTIAATIGQKDGRHKEIRRLGVAFEAWDWYRGSLFEVLIRLNLDELFLIVRDNRKTKRDDLIICEPTSQLSAVDKRKLGSWWDSTKPWSYHSLQETELLQRKSQKHQRLVEQRLAAGVSQKWLDKAGLINLASWKPPRIRYMEVTTPRELQEL